MKSKASYHLSNMSEKGYVWSGISEVHCTERQVGDLAPTLFLSFPKVDPEIWLKCRSYCLDSCQDFALSPIGHEGANRALCQCLTRSDCHHVGDDDEEVLTGHIRVWRASKDDFSPFSFCWWPSGNKLLSLANQRVPWMAINLANFLCQYPNTWVSTCLKLNLLRS